MTYDYDFEAGTDHPLYADDNVEIECLWNEGDAIPFGYWIGGSGELEFFVGDNGCMHTNPCGKAAREYFVACHSENIEDDAAIVDEAIDNLIDILRDGNYHYDSENEEFVSEDGSDTITIDDYYYDEIEGNLYNSQSEEYIKNILFKTAIGKINPTVEEIENHFKESIYDLADEYDWETAKGIDEGLQYVDSDFDSFFGDGELEGRVWTYQSVISFYEGQQPTPKELNVICKKLSNNIGVDYNYLLNYYIVYKNDDDEVKACTVFDYIKGNNNENETSNKEKRKGAVFVPHLANYKDKRNYFDNFLKDRAQNKYVPIEKKYGSLAAYHAQKYQESIKRIINNVINEHINRKRRNRV